MYFCSIRRIPSILRATYSTIFALSSGQGKCGVAVIRISGREAREAIFKMTKYQSLPTPRKVLVTPIKDPTTGNQLDRGIIIWFPEPRSFTGEDTCEFQVHGGTAVISSILVALSKLPGFRLAEQGEFTKRAFLAGKMDLTEVEGLSDLIHAETEQQRRQALKQMEGSLANLYKLWRTTLLQSLAHIEAYIDFSESEDIEDSALGTAKQNLETLAKSIADHLSDNRRGERLHNGVRTAIIGEPNVGKSSLLNYLVKRPAAIVAPIAGTTRDIVEVPVDVGGYPVVVADTAGLRQNTEDVIELEGIRRAKAWSATADLVIMVMSVHELANTENWKDYIESFKSNVGIDREHIIFPIINKIDLLSPTDVSRLHAKVDQSAVFISCTTGEGLELMLHRLEEILIELCGDPKNEPPTLTQERHRHHLTNCLRDLQSGLLLCDENNILIAAHKFKQAINHLGRITGQVTTEDILDVIFKDFCVGK